MKTPSDQTIVVLGASPNPERYSNRAVRNLKAHGYAVIPVNPAQKTIEGLPVKAHLRDVKEKIHTVTLYLSAENSTPLISDLVKLAPQRVIANPGAENGELKRAVEAAGIDYVEACTLVMLSVGNF